MMLCYYTLFDAFVQLCHHGLSCITKSIFGLITSETVFQIHFCCLSMHVCFFWGQDHCQDFSHQSMMILQMTCIFTGHLDLFQTSVTYVFCSEWTELPRQRRGHASSVTLTTESTFCCHFVASHYPNENTTGRKVTQNGHGCQNSFTLVFSPFPFFVRKCRQRDYGERVEDGVIVCNAAGSWPALKPSCLYWCLWQASERKQQKQTNAFTLDTVESFLFFHYLLFFSLNLGQTVLCDGSESQSGIINTWQKSYCV